MTIAIQEGRGSGYKGAFKYYISTFGGVGGLTRNAYLLMGLGGVLRQNAYITDLNSYSPEKGL